VPDPFSGRGKRSLGHFCSWFLINFRLDVSCLSRNRPVVVMNIKERTKNALSLVLNHQKPHTPPFPVFLCGQLTGPGRRNEFLRLRRRRSVGLVGVWKTPSLLIRRSSYSVRRRSCGTHGHCPLLSSSLHFSFLRQDPPEAASAVVKGAWRCTHSYPPL